MAASEVEGPDGDKYVIGEGDRYTQPIASKDNELPSVSAEDAKLIAGFAFVVVRLVVDETGSVVGVHELANGEPHSQALLAAVMQSCAHWRFSPLRKISRHQVESPNTDGSIDWTWVEEAVALPFHLDFQFRFSATGQSSALPVDPHKAN